MATPGIHENTGLNSPGIYYMFQYRVYSMLILIILSQLTLFYYS